MPNAELVITGYGVVHPSVPPCANAPADAWFDPATFGLGQGLKFLTVPTRYGLASTHLAVEMAGIAEDSFASEAKGIAFGTNFGPYGVWSKMDEAIVTQGAQALSPMEAPNFSVNLASSQISIKAGWRAFNVTTTSPVTAGLEAVILCQQALNRGRCEVAVAGSLEDALPAGMVASTGLVAGSGGACSLILEKADSAKLRGTPVRTRLGDSLQLFAGTRVTPDPSSPFFQHLRGALAGLLDDAAIADSVLSVVGPASPLQQATLDMLTDAFAARGATVSSVPAPEGSLSALMQLADMVAAGKHGLVIAVAPHGNIAAVSLRGPGPQDQT